MQEVERLLAVVGNADAMRPAAQHFRRYLLVDQIVLDDQDIQMTQVGIRRGRGGYAFCRHIGSNGQVDRDEEGAALAGRALDPDLALHQCQQTVADREAEAGAARFWLIASPRPVPP